MDGGMATYRPQPLPLLDSGTPCGLVKLVRKVYWLLFCYSLGPAPTYTSFVVKEWGLGSMHRQASHRPSWVG